MANLIMYYSRTGENYWDGSIRVIEKGNTERVAESIQEAVGGDLFRIETVEEYSPSYMTCIEEAKEELRQKARPAIKAFVDGLDAYDTVFVGYPNWWGTAPMCVFTFLEHYDWVGKRIIPFCTSEGSGLGGSVRMLKQACPGAVVEDGLAIIGNQAERSRDRVAAWAKDMAR